MKLHLTNGELKNEIIKASQQNPIILYDGQCIFCNSYIQYLIKRDKKDHFRFATLQSSTGQNVVENMADMDTVIMIDKGEMYTRSTVALKAAKYLPFPHSLIYVFLIIPAFIRNFFYDIIAKNRYRWFGKHNTCLLPDEKVKHKFLDI